jgi:hypothetical protein
LYLLDDFFDEVGRRVEKKAAEIAYARKEGSNAGVVTKSDLLEGAGLLAQTLVRDLENSLNASETVHGRRKAS